MRIAVALTMVAALIHVWVSPEHFEEWWLFGVLFVFVALLQGFYGVALWLWGGRTVYILGIVGNLAIVVFYLVTRTVGVPFGPHMGEVEAVGGLGLAATMSEVALVAMLALLYRQRTSVPGREAEVALAEGGETAALSRRDFLRVTGAVGALGASGVVLGAHVERALGQEAHHPGGHVASTGHSIHGGNGVVGDVDLSRFDPTKFLRDFYRGEERREGGRTVREFELTAEETEIEVAPGIVYTAWAYNGQVPGPTLRATEGERLRIRFKNNSPHPHTIHFHGFHPANMDGVFELVGTGQEFVYEFDAEPAGLHLYHCHTSPLRKHIEKGLYGAFIIDPEEGRPEADEMVMVMNGFDTNFDASNEVYAVNTVAFHYQRHPIQIQKERLIRVYAVNVLEFDFINSFHTHANFFEYYPTGTRNPRSGEIEPSEFTDTKIFGQGERGILEFRYGFPGNFMFHAHVSEFAELGWMGLFEVKE
ncbi:MAG TPA: multicopper oxidase domain-containing protein [Rubrobacter sp.]|nr:multicopper oxidase domain-containing protein [Rubrobacter sp.]